MLYVVSALLSTTLDKFTPRCSGHLKMFKFGVNVGCQVSKTLQLLGDLAYSPVSGDMPLCRLGTLPFDPAEA